MYGELPKLTTSTGQEVEGFPVQIQNPPKTAVLRLPTTDELMAYMSASKTLYRDLGRRKGEQEEVPNPAADLKLLKSLRIDKDGEEFDEYEALYAIGVITTHRVTECVRDGQEYVIKLATLFGDTTHRVRIPYQKEIADYRRTMYKVRDLPHGVEERTFPPAAPVKMYDAVIQEASGYLMGIGGVPPHHKRAVVSELMTAITLLDPDIDPNS